MIALPLTLCIFVLLRNILTIEILELQEENVIDKLKEKWWYLTSPCGVNSKSASSAVSLKTLIFELESKKNYFKVHFDV